jgi:hypothetical protein
VSWLGIVVPVAAAWNSGIALLIDISASNHLN